MKIAFIDPNLSTSERYGKALGKVGPTCEPLGLAYLAAAIKEKRNDKIKIIDAAASGYGLNELKNILIKLKPDVIGLRIITPMYLVAKDTIKMIKKNLPDVKIIVGGPHPTIFPKQTMEEVPEIDFVGIGEGEILIVEFMDAIEDKISIS